MSVDWGIAVQITTVVAAIAATLEQRLLGAGDERDKAAAALKEEKKEC
jgi:hypothetical protein